VPSQFAVGCIPPVLVGSNPFAQDKSSFDPNRPLLDRAAFAQLPFLAGYGNENFVLVNGLAVVLVLVVVLSEFEDECEDDEHDLLGYQGSAPSVS
jgi:hypothetical protein